MDKKTKIIIILISILSLVVVSFFGWYFFQIQSPVEIIPQFTNNEEVNKIIFNDTGSLRKAFGTLVLNSKSLVNLVHIVKEEDSSYEISCDFGPAYKTANLDKFYPKEIVSMGQIKDCTIETAKVIDTAINSPEKDCRVPMDTTEAFSSLADYYLVTLDIKEHKITQEWVDRVQGKRCFEPLKNLVGENIAIEFIVAIIDLKGNRIFY